MQNKKFPKITIVTPCFNSEKTIETTLSSIHNQNYPNLEHIVMDGGSTDSTLEIIYKYSEKISKIISEKDKGQYFAINEGFKHGSGEIFCWLNADDTFMQWSLFLVAEIFDSNSEIKWLTGIPSFIDESGRIKKIYNNTSCKPTKAIQNGWFRKDGYGYLMQESMFWRRELWEGVNGLNTQYKLAADFDLWIRFAKNAELWTVNLPLCSFRLHKESRSKILENNYLEEVDEICKNLKRLPLLFRLFGNMININYFLRLLTIKKTNLVYQKHHNDNLFFSRKFRSVSGLTFSQLILEL